MLVVQNISMKTGTKLLSKILLHCMRTNVCMQIQICAFNVSVPGGSASECRLVTSSNPGSPHNFMEINHELILTAIQKGQ